MNNIKKYRVLGVMSGTSLDGLDLCICIFTKKKDWKFKIEQTTTIKYPNYLQKKLATLHLESKKIIQRFDIKYAEFISEKINFFLKDQQVDFIASHGHTIFHQPHNNYTLQIGDGYTIAKNTGVTTINNFRNLDISLKGQGAPLVPVGDLHLFKEYKYCINLGGFANISIKENKKIIAFDICPVNIILNKISKNLNMDFDKNGQIAKSGKIIPKLLNKLNHLPFYKKKAPKSLSREWVDKNVTPLILKKYKSQDILNTFCEHIGLKIGKLLSDKSAIFTGGGVFNLYLMSRISFYSNSKIFIPDQRIINFKEALIFAFLGVLRKENKNNCLKSVTGAIKDNCGGEINNPY